jgi:ribonuclease P protein component
VKSLSGLGRIKQGWEFAEIRRLGERVVRGCLILNWRVLPRGQATRLGVVTSRQIGGAVVRSRARRLLREVARLHQHELSQPVAMVLVARRSIGDKSLAAVRRDFLAALRGANLGVRNPNS